MKRCTIWLCSATLGFNFYSTAMDLGFPSGNSNPQSNSSSGSTAEEKWKPDESLKQPGKPVFDETRGNWYYKRKYYKEARDLYKTIRQKTDDTQNLESVFYKKRSESEQSISSFNLDLGFQHGEVEEMLSSLSDSLTRERTSMVELTEVERTSLKDIADKKASLEALKKDMTILAQIDQALNKALSQALGEIGKARNYEEKAWQDYNNIAAEINDKKAEQLYLQMKNGLDNITTIYNHLNGDLMEFFDDKTQDLESKMDSVKSSVENLKSQGVELAKKVAQEEDEDLKRIEAEKKAAPPATAKPTQKTGWWQSFTSSVANGYSWITSKLSGSSSKDAASPSAVDKKSLTAPSALNSSTKNDSRKLPRSETSLLTNSSSTSSVASASSDSTQLATQVSDLEQNTQATAPTDQNDGSDSSSNDDTSSSDDSDDVSKAIEQSAGLSLTSDASDDAGGYVVSSGS